MLVYSRDENEGACRKSGMGEKSLLRDPGFEWRPGREETEKLPR